MTNKISQESVDVLHNGCRRLYRELRTPLDSYHDLYLLIKKYPEIAETMLKAIKKSRHVDCPFPYECKFFPCKTLSCANDTLTNGTPRRMT